jgi:hypothetical protein
VSETREPPEATITRLRPRDGGRKPPQGPIRYSPELGRQIAEAVATRLVGLDHLCAVTPGFPDGCTVGKWLHLYPEFADEFAMAKRRQAELAVFTGLGIAMDDRFDTETIERRDGSEFTRMNFEWVGRCKVASDYLWKLAGKLDPKVWGDRLDLDARVGAAPRFEDVIDQLR